MNATHRYRIGFIYGIVGALLYAVLLYFRYYRFATDPVSFGGFASISFIIMLIFFFIAARARKKQLGNYAPFRDIFQSVLLTILITEIGYAIFNLVYLHYINPGFFAQFKETTRALLVKGGVEKEKIDAQLSTFDNIDKQYSIANIAKGLGMWVLIDCIFGVIYASVLKKTKQDQ
jgi:hypothetical protein